jgi:hypothetical protein
MKNNPITVDLGLNILTFYGYAKLPEANPHGMPLVTKDMKWLVVAPHQI